MPNDEPFGTTPIPTSLPNGQQVEVWLDPPTEDIQQPQSTQIAVYEATPYEDCINGSLLDVNQHFVCYAVKNGLIRVLHRHSAMRALLRGHQNQRVTDIKFFLDGDVLGTVGCSEQGSTLIIWRVFEQSPEIKSEKLLEIPSQSFTMRQLIWHPFNPNQFWMFHTTSNPSQQVATLVETTRIQTVAHAEESHAVCQLHSPYCVMGGAVQLGTAEGSLTDLSWSGRDSRHVLTVHSDGKIILWDLKQLVDDGEVNSDITTPKRIAEVSETESFSRCSFLPHENSVLKKDQTDTMTTCFVTASKQNSVITLWSSFTTSPDVLPTKLQVIQMQNPSPSYVLDLCFGPAPQDASPPSCFLLLADRHKGKLFAIHVKSQWNSNQKALCVGGDYVVPFTLKHPVYSWSVVCSPTQDIAEDEIPERAGLIFDMKLFAYQSKTVQCLTLTSYMCLPPEHGYDPTTTPGVKVEALPGAVATDSLPVVGGEPYDVQYDEEYDVEDDEEEEQEEVEAPEASNLPAPGASLPNNPFANWLGAIASSSKPAAGSEIPPPPAPPSTPATGPATTPPGLPLPPPGLPPGLVANGENQPASLSSHSNGQPPLPPQQNQQQFLSPMDLLKNGDADAADTTAAAPNQQNNPNPKSTTSTPNKGRAATPNKGKHKPKKTRSRSPKNRKQKEKDKAASPFPDGAKISILKREDNSPLPSEETEPTAQRSTAPSSAPAAAIPPSDPAIIPMPAPPTAAPPVVMAASLSGPEQEAMMSRIVGEELSKQPPPISKADLEKVITDSVADSLVPVMKKNMQESLSSFGRPLQNSIDKIGSQGVSVNAKYVKDALDIEPPLRAALAENVRKVLIPALESISSQVLQQVAQSMPPPPPDQSKLIASMAEQLSSMNAQLTSIRQEMAELKSNIVSSSDPSQQQRHRPGPPVQQQQQQQQQSQQQRMEAIKGEVNALLQSGQYELAFTKALSTSSSEMAVYCCRQADLSAVMGGNTPKLSQAIMLCIMQQLGAALAVSKNNADLQTELAWLQEIALTLNPTDPSIARHATTVLQNLVASINQKMAEGNPQLRRPLHMLLQVIRGMQMG